MELDRDSILQAASILLRLAGDEVKSIHFPNVIAVQNRSTYRSRGEGMSRNIERDYARPVLDTTLSADLKRERAPSPRDTHDCSWAKLPNFAPPTSTLGSNGRSLKVKWHNKPIDLGGDPDRGHLHPQEIDIAQILRMSCAKYLHSKRKIFQGRRQALKAGRKFNKTAAQRACNIDVLKASQLWEAFGAVGWFEESHYCT